jgi:hypothetical protein
MPYTPHAKNAMLDALARGTTPKAIDRVSLHTAEPDENGSNEVSGGSYARQAVEWDAASGGSIDNKGSNPLIPVPAGTTVKFLGFWSDAAGTPKFEAFADITDETFTGAGVYEVTDADLDLAK